MVFGENGEKFFNSKNNNNNNMHRRYGKRTSPVFDYRTFFIKVAARLKSLTKKVENLENNQLTGDEVLYSPQNESNVRKRQARENIGISLENIAFKDWVEDAIENAKSDFTLRDSEGNFIDGGTVPISSALEIVVQDSTAIIKDSSGNVLKSENILAEGSKDIAIQDSEVVIKDSSDNTLKSENILAEGSKDISINDSTAIIKNSEGNTLKFESILAEGSKDITVQDSEVEIKNSAGTTLYSENIPAEQGEEFTIQDSTATIKDTDNNTLYSENILAEGSKDITIQDSSFTVKNSEENILNHSNILAQGSGEYTVQDSEVVIKDKFGNIIEQEDIPAEGSKEFTVNTELDVKNTAGQDVGQEVNGEIIVGDSNITVKDSEDNILSNFDVPAENNEEKVINDSTAIIKDSEGNILKSENILAEGSKDITITDSTSIIKDSAGATLYNENILAEGTKETTITDSTSTIKDSNGADLYVDSIVAQGSNVRTIANSTNVIKDSAGNTLMTTSILAEGSVETTIADSTYVVKNQDGDIIAQGSILAQGSVEILVDCFVGLRPLILTYNTNLYTDAIIDLSGVGSDPKDIIVRDSLGVVVKSLEGNTDRDVEITDLPAGIYDVEIFMEETSRMSFFAGSSRPRVQATLVEVKQWGDVVWGSALSSLFNGCSNLIITANDLMKMETTSVTDRSMVSAFQGITGITNTEWLEALPFFTMTRIDNMFNQALGIIDVVLDFNNASHLTNVNNMFRIGEFESIIINNMGSTLTATGSILSSNLGGRLETLILDDLQLSTNISGWRNGTAQDYVNFFESIGDRTGKEQRTITIRTQEWNKLDASQKAYVNQLLLDKNWALAH